MVVVWNKNIRELVWTVVSDKADKTRVVLVKAVKMHPMYKKRFVVRKKYYVHDAENKSKLGDEIRIRETKPMSRLKRWRLVEVM